MFVKRLGCLKMIHQIEHLPYLEKSAVIVGVTAWEEWG